MSAGEDLLAFQIKAHKLRVPEREVALITGRKFRWDFVWRWPEYPGLAVEVQGGTWKKGAHSSGRGIERDCEKACLAALAGYRTMFFTTDMVKDGRAVEWLRRALKP